MQLQAASIATARPEARLLAQSAGIRRRAIGLESQYIPDARHATSVRDFDGGTVSSGLTASVLGHGTGLGASVAAGGTLGRVADAASDGFASRNDVSSQVETASSARGSGSSHDHGSGPPVGQGLGSGHDRSALDGEPSDGYGSDAESVSLDAPNARAADDVPFACDSRGGAGLEKQSMHAHLRAVLKESRHAGDQQSHDGGPWGSAELGFGHDGMDEGGLPSRVLEVVTSSQASNAAPIPAAVAAWRSIADLPVQASMSVMRRKLRRLHLGEWEQRRSRILSLGHGQRGIASSGLSTPRPSWSQGIVSALVASGVSKSVPGSPSHREGQQDVSVSCSGIQVASVATPDTIVSWKTVEDCVVDEGSLVT